MEKILCKSGESMLLKKIAKLVIKLSGLDSSDREYLIVVCLSNDFDVTKYLQIANKTDIKTIIKTLLFLNSHRFILIQKRTNNIKITLDDIRTTKKIQDIANLLDIEFVDHIIINKDEYISCLYDDIKL